MGLNLEDPPVGVDENGPGQRPGPRVWLEPRVPHKEAWEGPHSSAESGRESPTRVLGLRSVQRRGLNKRQLSTVRNRGHGSHLDVRWQTNG